MPKSQKTVRILIQGIVQGVGFRPFIYNLARNIGILGNVRNTSAGVIIEAQGSPNIVQQFYQRIKLEAPALSRIETMERIAIPNKLYEDFVILHSEIQPGAFSLIPPDIGTCPDCLRELLDPTDRRYRYPFINCTNCGPRFSIIQKMPYDRPFTSMVDFPLCDACKQEYEDPTNRRFHAQPIACPVCGPQISYYVAGKFLAKGEEALSHSRTLIQNGGILALKGIGGFQLVCDAHNTEAIKRLRRAKLRSDKPFALMAYSAEIIRRYCEVTGADLEWLQSPRQPILILNARDILLQHNAPGQCTLGFMLPYTPLHYLITEAGPAYPDVLVMTSGNVSDEPMLIEDEEAFAGLSSMADGFLSHNRPILNRVDDSVYKTSKIGILPVRRARGYSPDPITITEAIPAVFSAGALLKNTFAITKENRVFVSQYMGDLDSLETYKDYEHSVSRYFDLFKFSPEIASCDLHPDYLSTSFAQHFASENNIDLIQVQHHHAHLAACLAENKLPLDQDIAALVYDGTGYGEDGTIWGGEILIGSALGYERASHLQYLPLPGGDAATRKPYRIALAYLHALGIPVNSSSPPASYCPADESAMLRTQLEKGINVHLTSSMGRLFDSVSSLIGLRQEISYEGQAAIELEAIADPNEDGVYPYEIEAGIIYPTLMFRQIIMDLNNDMNPSVISARFHNTIASLSVEMIKHIISDTTISAVALSGGVWQNSALLSKTSRLIREMGLKSLIHTLLPPNDGCISLGQAVIAGCYQKRKN